MFNQSTNRQLLKLESYPSPLVKAGSLALLSPSSLYLLGGARRTSASVYCSPAARTAQRRHVPVQAAGFLSWTYSNPSGISGNSAQRPLGRVSARFKEPVA